MRDYRQPNDEGNTLSLVPEQSGLKGDLRFSNAGFARNQSLEVISECRMPIAKSPEWGALWQPGVERGRRRGAPSATPGTIDQEKPKPTGARWRLG